MKNSNLIIYLVQLIISFISPDERQLRLILGIVAFVLGKGGVPLTAKKLGSSCSRVRSGLKEFQQLRASGGDSNASHSASHQHRIRRPGGGRKPIWVTQPGIEDATRKLLENASYGDPERPLRWTSKSRRHIASELRRQGFQVSHTTVKVLLRRLGFSLQKNRKNQQVGTPHPDKHKQFENIFAMRTAFAAAKKPVLSIDCKKKELIGNYAASGAEYAPKGKPVEVWDHDFGIHKANPYAVYDTIRNTAVCSLGTSADTAEFAVNSLLRWWNLEGKEYYGDTDEILILADGGGSNGSRNRLWKLQLQWFANTIGKTIHVCHYPPGTSKWNPIEHRLFSQISKNWRGQPLVSLEVMVNLISSTTTTEGLRVMCELDENVYEKGRKVSNKELAEIALERDEFHGNWNYCIHPQAA